MIKYKKIGSGRPFLFIHGWGMNSNIFFPLIDSLNKRKHECIMIDLPGMGLNSDCSDMNIEMIIELIEKNKIEEFDILGWSFGGQVAVKILNQIKLNENNKIFLVSSTPKFINEKQWHCGVDKNIFLKFSNELSKNPNKTIRKFIALQTYNSEHSKGAIEKLIKNVGEQKLNLDILHKHLELMMEDDLREIFEILSRFKTYLIAGKEDYIVPVESQYYMLDQYAIEKSLIIDKAGHIPFLSHTELCKNFIEETYE